MSDYNDLDCHYMLKEDVTRHQIADIVNTISNDFDWLQITGPKDGIVDSIFDPDSDSPGVGGIELGEFFNIYLSNMVARKHWNPAIPAYEPPGRESVFKMGIGHFKMDISSWISTGAVHYFDEWPQFAFMFKDLFVSIGEMLNAYLAFTIESYHIIYDDKLSGLFGIERYKWMIERSGSTFYVDEDLFNQIDMEENTDIIHSIEGRSNGSSVINICEIPLIYCETWPMGTAERIHSVLHNKMVDRIQFEHAHSK